MVKQAFFGFLLFIIGLFRLYNYLTVSSYCNKQIKTVKSLKTINYILVIVWMMSVLQSFNIIV